MKPAIRRALTLLLLGFGFGLPAPARAHEPLFGETPVVFGPGVYHLELKFHSLLAGSLRRPPRERTRMYEAEAMLDYGVDRRLNLRVMLPYMVHQHGDGRFDHLTTASGIGDVTLRAKYRYHLRQATGYQSQQSLLVGLKLPTGSDDTRGHDGSRLPASEQLGSGKVGILLGIAWDRERLSDTLWASAVWHRDLGSGFRRGDLLEADVAYGPWLIRANRAEDLALNLAIGLHAELAASDPIGGGRTAENGYRLLGIHVTPIVTQGRNQYRIGILVPILRGGYGPRTDFRYLLGAAWETFF